MEIHKILEKLEPIMPGQVSQWRKSLHFVNEQTKSLLEKHIISTAYDVLGDFDKKLLLSLPSEKKAKGTFQLGTIVYDKERWAFGIKKQELLQHLAIVGRSGAGKTNAVYHLVNQLARKDINFLILDWKRNYRDLLGRVDKKVAVYTAGRSLSPFIFNPLIIPPSMEQGVYIGFVTDVLASAFDLGEGAKSLIQQALSRVYQSTQNPTFNDVLHEIEALEVKNRAHGWKASALRALQTLSLSNLSGDKKIAQPDLVEALLHSNTIIELDALSENLKKFIVPLLLLWLYQVKLGTRRREKLDLVCVIEESHHFYRQGVKGKTSLMDTLARQVRELGMAFVYVDQQVSAMSSSALGNVYSVLCLSQRSPSDINKAASLLLLDEHEKKWLGRLSVGQGIIRLSDRWTRPVLLNIRMFQSTKVQ